MINYAWLPRMHSSARPILWGWGVSLCFCRGFGEGGRGIMRGKWGQCLIGVTIE